MKKFIILFSLFIFFITGCSKENENEQIPTFAPYKIGDEISLKGVAGGEVSIIRTEHGFKLKNSDKILMFDIFGTYCVPCQEEAPHLVDFQIKNSNKFMLVGLIHFEDITDDAVLENFTKKYNAYYFISNSKQNDRLVEQILDDINYKRALQIPFKVVLKDGIYQELSDNLGTQAVGNKFYLGKVSTQLITKDINRIINAD